MLREQVINLESCTFERVSELRLPLVNRFYSSCNYRVKCGRLERIFSLSLGGNIIAAARLIPQHAGHYLLRNLCVDPDLRGQGIASYLMRATLTILGDANCYCYALPHLQNFYLSLNFQHFTPDQVPTDISDMHIRHCSRKRGWILMGYIGASLDNQQHK
ncbi:MAG: N-acetyltransferase [Sphingobacteriales bacterium]|nr:MAG: N-acetyltransferase [Sphingobacteriales bacterium]